MSNYDDVRYALVVAARALDKSRCRRGCCLKKTELPFNSRGFCPRCWELSVSADSADRQDLSRPCIFTYGEVDGKRWVAATLPIPAWTKHDRKLPDFGRKTIYTNPVATKYREWMGRFFLFEREGLTLPWIRTEYELSFTNYTWNRDCDQWASGLTDDLGKPTTRKKSLNLLADDKHCACITIRRVKLEKEEEQRIEFRGWEL